MEKAVPRISQALRPRHLRTAAGNLKTSPVGRPLGRWRRGAERLLTVSLRPEPRPELQGRGCADAAPGPRQAQAPRSPKTASCFYSSRSPLKENNTKPSSRCRSWTIGTRCPSRVSPQRGKRAAPTVSPPECRPPGGSVTREPAAAGPGMCWRPAGGRGRGGARGADEAGGAPMCPQLPVPVGAVPGAAVTSSHPRRRRCLPSSLPPTPQQ